MKIPISWLKDYVNIDCDVKTLADRLTMSGSKVEKIEHLGADITNVVVGRIAAILPHPNADKLVVTHVDIGETEHKQVVTGATNLKEGDYIPVALHGANLAGGLKIKKGKIRGEASDGMLCSIEELGYTQADYPEAHPDGIYVFAQPQPLGADARFILGLLEDVLEFEITSNRPDCYSIVGMARETAATLGTPLQLPEIPVADDDTTGIIGVEIKNAELCPRYIARVVQNVRIEPSPQWLRRRLINAGLRPVNNIVDITNYVMLEYGQPMHAFDIRAIDGHVVVRNAADGEKITTLDGVERTLDADMLVIADTTKAVGIAGIMGGEHSKITDDTTTILFESANFYGPNIRQTAKRLGVRTDSSAKYEKGLDPNLSLISVNRACQLVQELACGDVLPGMVDCHPSPRLPGRVPFDAEKINALLGINASHQEMADIFSSLGICLDGDTAIIPTHRNDIKLWQDLAEEVARIYGYDNIPTAVASSSNVGKKSQSQLMEQQLTDTMVALGFCQSLSYAFESPKVFDKLLIPTDSPLRDTVRIINPLGEDTSVMRTTMLSSMLTSLSTNNAKRNEEAALFEIAKIYHPNAIKTELPDERQHLIAGYYGPKDFFHIKGIMEAVADTFGVPTTNFAAETTLPFFHPGRCGRLYVDDVAVATIGQVHPAVAANYDISRPVYLAVFYLEKFFAAANLNKTYTPLPRFPESYRDIAVVVDNAVINGDLIANIRKNGGKYLRQLQLFDVYTGDNVPTGTKSMAYNLTFRADDRTLTDEEISGAMAKIVAALEATLGAKLRA
ncbi:MAG: phenylalanine--tRNA ligase subunit beta [Defluviitaleaceae bacterium]|nr:phenylalanine--tRNA ligase subunit beta [Defluviitaleaceae bacterium]